MITTPKKVGILCTGNELVEGRVLNTNTQMFAGLIAANGMIPGFHLTVPDNEAEMDQTLIWMLANHDAVITCGGLGPTSDDKTRNTIARVAKQKLIFSEINWQTIQARLQSYHIEIHSSNKQQAYYPEGATIIDNGFGTAAGFMVMIDTKPVFVMPGPPHECQPMMEAFVIPTLQKMQFGVAPLQYFARLIGISEADIAARIDAALNTFDVETAFCWQYPYCDILVKMHDANDRDAITKTLDALLDPYCVGHQKKSASECLRETLIEKQIPLTLHDECSGGLLYASLFSPQTNMLLNPAHPAITLSLKGLQKWLDTEPVGGDTQCEIEITGLSTPFHIARNIPYRGARVRAFAVEYACFCLLKKLHEE